MENKEIPGSNCIWTEFENVDKMDKSLEKYDLPTLRQDETKSLSRPPSIKGIELTNKNISTENKKQKKLWDQMVPQVKSIKYLRKI